MESIARACESIPFPGRYIAYGTAGFRTLATDLPMVFFRAGLVALLRAYETNKFIGIMVTASHNQISDNGLKMIDHNGEMLPLSWEKIAEEIANAPSLEAALRDKWPDRIQGTILIGHDNRPSSPILVDYIKSAIRSSGCEYHDYGLVTTPQLHYLVLHSNNAQQILDPNVYVNQLKSKADLLFTRFAGGPAYETALDVDCSGGVGHGTMVGLAYDWISLYNVNPEHLNDHCGAEYAHKERKLPRSLNTGRKCASFDGDADRLVYYYSKNELEVLGGERLTVLYAAALNKLMKIEGLEGDITVVTTGYSNFASIKYLKDQGIKCVIVPTGVKYLHHEAKAHEISIYFESNGHGTILHQREKLLGRSAENTQNFLELANETVGDAVADLLLAEVSLRILDWSLQDWLDLYQDFPNIMLPVKSNMKDLIKNSWDQMDIIEPQEFSNEVKSIIDKYQEYHPRTLIRPSGTEPIVRVYVEASSLDVCRSISEEIIKLL